MNDNILPLFTNYLHDYCFSQSLIGKIGIIGDYADIQQAQEIIKLEAKNTHQQRIKKTLKIPLPIQILDKRNTFMEVFFNMNFLFRPYG